jgi:hypothetical protein
MVHFGALAVGDVLQRLGMYVTHFAELRRAVDDAKKVRKSPHASH